MTLWTDDAVVEEGWAAIAHAAELRLDATVHAALMREVYGLVARRGAVHDALAAAQIATIMRVCRATSIADVRAAMPPEGA